MAVHAVVLSHHRKRQAPLRESMGWTVESYAAMLERQPVIVLDIGIGNVDVSDELAAKSFKLKVRMDGITHLKSQSAKAVQVGSNQCQLNFDTSGKTIYEGGQVFDFELCQAHSFGSSQTTATCQLSADAVLQNANAGRKIWSLELLSVSTPGKVVARFDLQLCCTKTSLIRAGGAKALKSMRVPTQPTNTKSGSVFAFNEDAEDAREYVRKAGRAQEQLAAVMSHVESITSKRFGSDLRLRPGEKSNRVEL